MFLPQCERPKEDIICNSTGKGINALDLYNDEYSDSPYYANGANKPGAEVRFLSGIHDDCGGARLTARSMTSQLCTLPEPQE